MKQISVIRKSNIYYEKIYYVLIDPNKIESISISDERNSNNEFPMWIIIVNLPHYSYQLVEENSSRYYWSSYDKAIEYLKKIELYND